MPRVKITNLKPGPIVVNSLKITIPGGASVVRDASVVGDADLSELEADGLIRIEDAGEAPKPVRPAYTPQAQQAAQTTQQTGKTGHQAQGVAKSGKANQKPKPRPGTDFRAVDGPEEEMVVVVEKDGPVFRKVGEKTDDGNRVVVMGDDGPEVRKMNPGVNGRPGPKFVGDTGYENPEDSQEDVELPDNSDIHAV